jgi:hypothetical protein
MADTKKDPEVGALEAVHTALKTLDASARQRVLASVYALLEITPPAAKTPGQGGRPAEQPARPQVGRPMSPVELIKEKKPTSNIEKITLFAYYRDRHEGVARFARDDLRPYFAKAHETMPGNFDRDFVEAVRRGWIHEDGSESYITSKGIEVVEAAFPPEPAKGKTPKKKQQKKTRGK